MGLNPVKLMKMQDKMSKLAKKKSHCYNLESQTTCPAPRKRCRPARLH